MDLGLKGKRAVITGGSRGIGAAVAELLAEQGCDVAFCSRNPDQVNARCRLPCEPGGELHHGRESGR